MRIPKLNFSAYYMPEAWERVVLGVMDKGVDIKTEYDKQEDPPSKDATVSVTIESPLEEPRLHKNIPCGLKDLEVYRQEVVNGIHDHWIDKEGKGWNYTYHDKLFNFQSNGKASIVNQIDYIVNKLASSPYSRRAQAITWNPPFDTSIDDPSCLQRIWTRLLPDNNGGFSLNVRLYWRSRDLWKAWMMNMWGLTSLIEHKIFDPLNNKLEGKVYMGNLVDTMDSCHIYGSYMDDKFYDEIEKMRDISWDERVLDSNKYSYIFEEVKENLSENPDYYKNGGGRFS